MQLSIKDIFPTATAAGSAYVGWLAARGAPSPLNLSSRWVVVGLLLVGIVACATGGSSAVVTSRNAWTIALSATGGLAALVAIVGIIKPMPWITITLAALIVAMWAATTVRHAVT